MEKLLTIYDYIIHDTLLSNVTVSEKDSTIILSFNEGVYYMFSDKKTDHCEIRVYVETNDNSDIEDHLMIHKFYKRKNKFIELEELKNILTKYNFSIANVYVSKFNREILITGGYSKGSITITIYNCVKIDYVFN